MAAALRATLAVGALALALATRRISQQAGRSAQPCTQYLRSTLKRALLISNSKLPELEYLAHVLPHISSFLGEASADSYVLFVPYAQRDRDAYAAKVRHALRPTGYAVRSLHDGACFEERKQLVCGAEAIFVGGGNTYRLLKCMQMDQELLPLIAQRVLSGSLKYIGSSAGTNLACPTIRNTNDMPIVWPERGVHGLCLVPFQINTHYIDESRELKNHMGETRAKRLEEFMEENDVPVLALREGASVLVEGESAKLLGPVVRPQSMTWDGARLLCRPAQGGAREIAVGDSLDFLMTPDVASLPLLFDVSPLLSDAGQDERKVIRSDDFKSG